MHESTYQEYAFEEYVIKEKPFYLPVGHEAEVFEAAYARKLPVLLKGPTGCGKTRFVEYMAHRLGPVPLITVACHEDLTATDLVGRYLLEGQETRWLDGPLTRAVKAGVKIAAGSDELLSDMHTESSLGWVGIITGALALIAAFLPEHVVSRRVARGSAVDVR